MVSSATVRGWIGGETADRRSPARSHPSSAIYAVRNVAIRDRGVQEPRMEVVVRYITRAHERHDSRRRLYQAVLERMHGKRETEGQGAVTAS
jgi:hypothetical protein